MEPGPGQTKELQMKWGLMGKRARGQQNIGDYCQYCIGKQGCNIRSCIGELYECHLLVRYWRVAEEYHVFGIAFAGLMWYPHRRYPKRSKPHQWKMLAYLPPGLPGTL